MFKNPLVLFIIIALQFILVLGIVFYVAGIRKYGSPAAYKTKQEEIRKAAEDSLKAFRGVEAPENIADSTLTGMIMESNLISESEKKANVAVFSRNFFTKS